jgi:hypothetical protein
MADGIGAGIPVIRTVPRIGCTDAAIADLFTNIIRTAHPVITVWRTAGITIGLAVAGLLSVAEDVVGAGGTRSGVGAVGIAALGSRDARIAGLVRIEHTVSAQSATIGCLITGLTDIAGITG